MSNIGNKEVFAQNLAFYVTRSGKDQKIIAEEIGVAASTFNEWMKAKKYPRIDKIDLLANYFGILKSDLIESHYDKELSPDQIVLTEGEEKLLQLFRQIPEDRQALVIQMIEVALSNL